jgi:hypothetical protein
MSEGPKSHMNIPGRDMARPRVRWNDPRRVDRPSQLRPRLGEDIRLRLRRRPYSEVGMTDATYDVVRCA